MGCGLGLLPVALRNHGAKPLTGLDQPIADKKAAVAGWTKRTAIANQPIGLQVIVLGNEVLHFGHAAQESDHRVGACRWFGKALKGHLNVFI